MKQLVQRWIGVPLAHPRSTVALCLLSTVAWLPLLPRLHIEADGRSLLPPRSAAILDQTALEREFSGADFMIVTLDAETPEALFSPPPLNWLRRFTAAVGSTEIAGPDGVRGLSSDPAATWTPGGLTVAPPIAGDITTPAEAAAVRAQATREPMFARTLVGADAKSVAAYVPVRSGVDRRRARQDVERLAARELVEAGGNPDRLRFLGPVVAESTLAEYVLRDLLVLLPAATLLVGLVLAIWFRAIRMALLGLAEAIVCVVWTLGLMAATSTPVTLVGVLCPVILIAYCVSDTIYIAQRFREKRLAARSGWRSSVSPKRSSAWLS